MTDGEQVITVIRSVNITETTDTTQSDTTPTDDNEDDRMACICQVICLFFLAVSCFVVFYFYGSCMLFFCSD